MKKNDEQQMVMLYRTQSMAVSIGLHLFLFGLVYCMRSNIKQGIASNPSYTISIQPNRHHKTDLHTDKPIVNNKQTENVEEQKNTLLANRNATNKNQKIRNKTKKPLQDKQTNSSTKTPQNVNKEATLPIDHRGLYKATSSKQAGATLELTGWKWDRAPSPDDTSEEYGKIVFEIKVDENGEIISIQTIEKTVTPMVEKIYADALRGITFSKTSELQSYSKISTGKVTFILVAT